MFGYRCNGLNQLDILAPSECLATLVISVSQRLNFTVKVLLAGRGVSTELSVIASEARQSRHYKNYLVRRLLRRFTPRAIRAFPLVI